MPARLPKHVRNELVQYYFFDAKMTKSAMVECFKNKKISKACIYRLLEH